MLKIHMKLKTFILLFFLWQNAGYGQSFVIEYIDVRNIPTVLQTDSGFVATLFYKNNQSLYIHHKLKKGEKFKRNKIDLSKEEIMAKAKRGEEINVRRRIYEDSIGQFIYKNFSTRLMQVRLFYDNEPNFRGIPKIHEEPVAKIDWKIEKEQKKIGNFVCQKATARFRGRNYTAWFAPEIPISAGPWKLHGLAGIILEAYDDTKEIQFLFKSIQYPAEVGEIEPKYENLGQKITFKEYQFLYCTKEGAQKVLDDETKAIHSLMSGRKGGVLFTVEEHKAEELEFEK